MMAVSYKKLWKILIDRDMMKKDLCEQAGLSTYTMSKMKREENVTIDTLEKICRALNCPIQDILEFIENDK